MTSVTKAYPGIKGVWSSAGSNFNGSSGEFPGVPFGKGNFHNDKCNRDIQGGDYHQDKGYNVRMCRLVGLIDLDHGQPYVQDKIAAYMNGLIDLGVAGFRVDAVKHIWPKDLEAILGKLKPLRSDIFGQNQRPFVVSEVIDYGGEAVSEFEYTYLGKVTNFKYGNFLAAAVRREGQNFRSFNTFGQGWNMLSDYDSVVFVDNHDSQRDSNPLTYKEHDRYVMANAFMLAYPYGYPSIMSSFHFTKKEQGPPSLGHPTWEPISPIIMNDQTCAPDRGWVCEHRWPAIRRMTQFRGICNGESIDNIETDDHRIAFRRGNKGFFALNNHPTYPWERKFYTGLPQGNYCDIISGERYDKWCTGRTISVDKNGDTFLKLEGSQVVAIHIYQKL